MATSEGSEMTPVEEMQAAASRNPQFTKDLLALPRHERERKVRLLMLYLNEEHMHQEAEELRLVAGHVEIKTLAPLTR